MKDLLQVFTVTGPISPDQVGVTDAHAHIWIDKLPGQDPDMPCLDSFDQAKQELEVFLSAGGRTVVDCQPGFAGRNGVQLKKLSQETNVYIIASTGFHLEKYYPQDNWLFAADVKTIAAHFIKELTMGLEETPVDQAPILAGQIKAAIPASPDNWPQNLMKGAAEAALATSSAIHVHTERGASAIEIVQFFENCGLNPHRLVLAHMDKRADFNLHKDLIQLGALLEYDTFSRGKYKPEEHVWPLIQKIIESDLTDGIAIANDLAYKHEWHAYNGEPGLASLITTILPRLKSLGLNQSTLNKILGGNIARILARPLMKETI